MESSQVIQEALQGNPREGWAVFRFMFLVPVLRLLGWGVMFFLFSTGAYFLFASPIPAGSDAAIQYALGGFMILSSILFLYLFFPILRAVIHGRSSILVLTDKALVQSYQGNISEFPYVHIRQMRLMMRSGKNTMPETYIVFTDKRNNKYIEIDRGRHFGGAAELFNFLKGKVDTASAQYVQQAGPIISH